MLVLSPVDVEAFVSDLVGDSIPHFASEHHCAAPHVVVHDVLQNWLTSILFNQIKKDLFICRYLNSHITLDVVNETTDVDSVVLFPFPSPCDLVCFYLEKQDLI